MRTLLNIFSVRNAIKRKKDLFSLKRSATCVKAKNNLLKRFATSARAEVAQLALCASNCGMPTSALLTVSVTYGQGGRMGGMHPPTSHFKNFFDA